MFPGVTSRLSVASVELSEFVNGESFVGRELARRVVSASSAKEYGRCDDDDESLILLLLHHSCCNDKMQKFNVIFLMMVTILSHP